jgi:hypothetical protein
VVGHIEKVPERWSQADIKRLSAGFESYLADALRDECEDSHENGNNPDLMEELADDLEFIGKRLNIDVAYSAAHLRSWASQSREGDENVEEPGRSSVSIGAYSEDSDLDKLREMFGSLLSRDGLVEEPIGEQGVK